jgi:hypothetical protein
MKELEMGDIVEVKAYNWKLWESRIFIKHGKNNGIICVDGSCNTAFKNGENFETAYWEKEEWRFPEEKSYRHFTWEERDILRDKWIKHKDNTHEAQIVEFSMYNEVHFVQTRSKQISFKKLLEDYTTLNGDVLGVEEK